MQLLAASVTVQPYQHALMYLDGRAWGGGHWLAGPANHGREEVHIAEKAFDPEWWKQTWATDEYKYGISWNWWENNRRSFRCYSNLLESLEVGTLKQQYVTLMSSVDEHRPQLNRSRSFSIPNEVPAFFSTSRDLEGRSRSFSEPSRTQDFVAQRKGLMDGESILGDFTLGPYGETEVSESAA